MVKPFIGYGRQAIDRSDIEAVVEVLGSAFLTQGPAVERFEDALAEYCSVRHAIAVSNGTAALHIACLAADMRAGDIGLTAAITFAASANCMRYAGADPSFVDIDPGTLGMDPSALERMLVSAPEAKIVIPVHMSGLAHASAEIRAIAGSRLVIEDAAHSLGGAYVCGKPVGSCAYSDMTTLSFHPVKSITTGEGGAVLTNDPVLARRLRLLRSHGIERDADRFVGRDACEADGTLKPWLHELQDLGFNYRMTDIQAALGLSQLGKIDKFIARRRQIAARYDQAFSNIPALRIPQSGIADRRRSAHHLYVVLIDFAALNTTRTAIMGRLRSEGVGSQVHYIPVYRHPYYADRGGAKASEYPNAETYYRACLSLPLYPSLTDEDVERVIGAVKQSVAI